MVIYNKKILENPPVNPQIKIIKPKIEDVLMTFVSSEQKGNLILTKYSISYFNIPANVSEYRIANKIDMTELNKIVKETVGAFKSDFISVRSLTAKEVIFEFNVKEFLKSATYPTSTVRKAYNIVALKLNKKIPAFIQQSSASFLNQMMSEIMTSIIRGDKKYKNIFSTFKKWYYNRNSVLNATYDEINNQFIIELENPFKYYYYFYNKKSSF